MLKLDTITATALERQHLFVPVSEDEYDELFRLMSPVPTVYWTTPGDPPTLPPRADFDDYSYNTHRRRKREIIKGRFQGGGVGYIYRDELELFAAAYNKSTQISINEMRMLELLKSEGPLTIGLIKELTGMLAKNITPVLHKLQQAFLVYEDQTDNDGDRGWYLMENEFPDVDINRYSKQQALEVLIKRFAYLNVLIDDVMLRSYFKLPLKELKQAVNSLLSAGTLINASVDSRDGYMLSEDMDTLSRKSLRKLENQIIALHRSDYLVKSNELKLKGRYTHPDAGLLQYLLIDGSIRGAIMGRFRFGPAEIEDVVLDLPADEAAMRKDEIISAIYTLHDIEGSPIKRFCGEKL